MTNLAKIQNAAGQKYKHAFDCRQQAFCFHDDHFWSRLVTKVWDALKDLYYHFILIATVVAILLFAVMAGLIVLYVALFLFEFVRILLGSA